MSDRGSATPAWLVQAEVGLCPCGCIGRRRKSDFVEKTIVGGAGLMQRTMFAEDVAARTGLLQRLDARVKVVSLLALLVATAFAHNVAVLVGLYALSLGLAAASGLSLRFFVPRVWLFIPIFTGVIVLPATLNVITPGEIVVPLGHWFGSSVGLTQQGLTAALLIVARVATSISFAVLLTLTTPWPRLLNALQSLRVPRFFVLVTGMAYRYLFYLIGAVTDMYVARKARTPGRERSVKSGRGFVAASAGALFGKTFALSEEVHMAMVSRGHTAGRVRRPSVPVAATSWVFLAGTIVVAGATIGVDHVLAR